MPYIKHQGFNITEATIHTTMPPDTGRQKGGRMDQVPLKTDQGRARIDQTHLRWTRQALSKARAKEIKISWDGYYPMCPGCGSREVERRYRSGEIWPYCPNCGQRLKDLKMEPKRVLPEIWRENIMQNFERKV